MRISASADAHDRIYLDTGAAGAPGYLQMAQGELKEAFNLAMAAYLLLGLLALGMLVGWHTPVYLPLGCAMLLVVAVFARLLVARLDINRVQLYLWRVVLLAVGVLQASLWLYYLMHLAGNPNPELALGTLAAILAAMPLLYWPAGLLAVLLAASSLLYTTVPAPLRWWLALGVAVLLLAGLLVQRLLVEQRRYRGQESRNLEALEEYELRCLDAEEQLLYGRERLASCHQELADVRELAEEAGRVKTEFLATISHEIRTPLNGILPILEMLQGTRLNEEQQRFVRAASSSSKHLLRIINDILDFARAESGKLQLESIEVNLKELAQSVLDLMAGSAKRKDLKLKLHIDAEVPAVVRGDPVRLRQVLANLLSNAIKFTEQGGVELAIEQTRSGRREVELRFGITDTGIGLSTEEAKGLFSSFSQADASTTRKHGGTGMGLAICRRLVELMGGRIGVHSVRGQGSTFWFILPMRRSLHDVPTTRASLEGVRLVSAIADQELASRVSEDFRQWRVREERTPPDNLVPLLRDTTALGKSWSFDCVLLDDWGNERDLIASLQEIRADPLLGALNIIVISDSPELGKRLHRDFSAYVISEGHQAEPLRHLLNRLFDVAGSASPEANYDGLSRYMDLNLEQESVLLPDTDDAEASEEGNSGPRVLLAEDNPVNLGVVQRVLKRLGARCLVAENGQKALDILERGAEVDMILMDCQMPVMDGYAATRVWREHERRSGGHVPIVAMTANVMPGDREKCLDSGMDDYLAKPVSIDELAQALRKWGGTSAKAVLSSRPVADRREGNDRRMLDRKFVAKKGESKDRRMLDRGIVAELREVMEDGFDELVETYLNNSPELMEALQRAAEAGDVKALVASAHSLKSSSANMGATELTSLAGQVETAARLENLEVALSAYRKMPAVYIATCAALRFELGVK